MAKIVEISKPKVLTRSQRLWERALEARDTNISLWRARLLTKSWKTTGGLPRQIRRAKAFKTIMAEFPIYIDDEQLLVGDFGAWPGAAECHPEQRVTWIRRELEEGRLPYGLDEDAVTEFKGIIDYWSGRCARDAYFNYMDPDEKKYLAEMCDEGAYVFGLFLEAGLDKGWYSPDYEKAIRLGFSGILAEVEEELKATKVLDDASREKKHLLKAIVIELKAAIAYSRRYAALARDLAGKENGDRKVELERIAEICERVPENPARNFWEALQTLWFVHLLGFFDTSIQGRSPGRVDQYLYPYYKRDIDEGRLTREEAIELLGCLRVKMHPRNFENVYSHVVRSGEASFHNCTLGGQTVDGKDATNELSFLWLEAAFRVRSPHPTLSVRWHTNLNPEFAMRAAELTKLGLGYPAWFGDDANIAYCMGPWMGATLEEARDYQLSGCVLSTIPHKTPGTWPLSLNMGKIFELTMHDGKDPGTGKQFGPHTGKFMDMERWEDIYPAYKEQVSFFLKLASGYLNEMRLFQAQMVPQIFYSAFFDDCIKRGLDPLGGGPIYQGSTMYLLPIGIMDAVDSLAAIRRIVFDEKKISKQQLMEALGANFDGYEDIQRILLKAPKYGNDDDYVDHIAREMYALCVDVCSECDAPFGAKWVCAPHSVGMHSYYGRRVGALPSGRPAGYALADGAVSPCQGADFRGPTASINSAGKIDHLPIYGTLFNMKFHPSSLNTKEDLQKLLGLIKTYFHNYGGKHIQFNVVSKEMLEDAQVHPDKHKNLVVRVAGYSALWVELDRTLQDEIIGRAEKGW